MNLKRAASRILFLVWILSTGCHSAEERPFADAFYEKSEREWLEHMTELGYQEREIRNHVLLVLKTTECAPCLRELVWWNTKGTEQLKAEISMIVIERHQAILDAFLEETEINIPVFRDSAAVLFKDELIPATPVKIYFNEEGTVTAFDYLGTEGDLRSFLDSM